MIPDVKAYLYGGLLAAALIAFGWWSIHERDEQKTADAAHAATAVAKDNALVASDDKFAQTSESSNVVIWKKAVAVPAVGDVDIVCQRAAPGVPLSAAHTVAGGGTGNAAAHGGSGPAFNPGPGALERAHVADAQIAYLQRRIAELEKQMNDSP